jgi:hypothetical protein
MINILPIDAEYQEPFLLCSDNIDNFSNAIFIEELHKTKNFVKNASVAGTLYIEKKEEDLDKRIYEIYLDDSLKDPVGFYEIKSIDFENHSACYEINLLKNTSLSQKELENNDFHFKERLVKDLSLFEKQKIHNHFGRGFFSITNNLFEYYLAKKMVFEKEELK